MAARRDMAGLEDADPFARLFLKMRARDPVSPEEERVVRESFTEFSEVPPNRVVVKAGVTVNRCTLLVDGYIARYRDLADGQRQIMEIHVPGDFLDLHSFLLKKLEHNVGALTPARLATMPHAAVTRITEDHPHLARLLWFSTLLDAALHRERILSVGRRSAIARVAHLLCELNARLELVGLAKGGRFAMPLTQIDIADACGLTAIHVNRMFRKLREEGLATFRGGEIVLRDHEKLMKVAEYSDAFLHLEAGLR